MDDPFSGTNGRKLSGEIKHMPTVDVEKWLGRTHPGLMYIRVRLGELLQVL